MKTYMAKKGEVERKWYIIDAKDKIVGRLATKIATILRGKHKPVFTPHVDTGDFVIVINADKIKFTGKKLEKKVYYRHTGYIGNLKATSAKEMLQKKPEEIIRLAVKGMLPKNKMRKKLLKKLRIYVGEEHPHQAQKPEKLEI